MVEANILSLVPLHAKNRKLIDFHHLFKENGDETGITVCN